VLQKIHQMKVILVYALHKRVLSDVPTKFQNRSFTLWSKHPKHHYFSSTYQEHLKTHANSCKPIASDHQPHSHLLSFTDSMNVSIHYTLKTSTTKSFTWF